MDQRGSGKTPDRVEWEVRLHAARNPRVIPKVVDPSSQMRSG
jgi:hypothetical protein